MPIEIIASIGNYALMQWMSLITLVILPVWYLKNMIFK